MIAPPADDVDNNLNGVDQANFSMPYQFDNVKDKKNKNQLPNFENVEHVL